MMNDNNRNSNDKNDSDKNDDDKNSGDGEVAILAARRDSVMVESFLFIFSFSF